MNASGDTNAVEAQQEEEGPYSRQRYDEQGEPLCIRARCQNWAADENARCAACRAEEGE